MAKDPAVLFYTSDFLSGTFTMDYEQKGKYITLLCIQHQKGFLTEKDIKQILTDTDIELFDKFQLLEDGFYYNLKMKDCAEKRRKFSESRSNNRKGKTKNNSYQKDMNNISSSYNQDMINISKSYLKDMENENENEDLNKDLNVNLNKVEADKLLDQLLDITTYKKAQQVIKELGGIDVIFSVMEFDETVKKNWLNHIQQKENIFS
jgi:hypothetical protein